MEAGGNRLSVFAPAVGRWRGTSQGRFGSADVSKVVEYVFDGTFLRITSHSASDTEIHEDIGVVSHDVDRGHLMLREFHSEGYVNTYRQSPGTAAGVYVFDSTHIENPFTAGLRARLTVDLSAPGILAESLALGVDHLEVCVEAVLHPVG